MRERLGEGLRSPRSINKLIRYFTFLLLLCAATPAHAAITITEKIQQRGIFLKTDCEPDATDASYDACRCEADVRYPELTGMADAEKQTELNAAFKKSAEQAQCEGVATKEAAQPAATKEAEKSPSSASHHYDITFQSPDLLGLEFTDWGYSGGAHGNGTIEGVIVDLKTGKILALEDVFAAKDIPAINDLIYTTLSALPEEQIFKEGIESRKGAFIKDGICQGCSLVLAPDGIKAVFQTYEVASYAAGNMEVLIPANLVAYPAIATALTNHTNSVTTPVKP